MKESAQPTLLVMRAGAIGDLVLTLPALEALRERFPQYRLVLAARSDMLPLLLGSTADEVIAFDSLLLAPLFSPGAAIPSVLREKLGRLRMAILWLPQRAAQTVGEALRKFGAEQIVSADPMPGDMHAAEHMVAALAPLGIASQRGATPMLTVPERAYDEATWQRLGIEPDTRVVALHTGSGGAAKRWPLERFMEIAERLAALPNTRVLLMRGPAEEGLDAIHKPRPGIILVDSPSLPALATILLHCALYIGNDSGITHLAAALGRPTVALFGPTDAAIWGPRGAHVRIVRSADRHMHNLSAERVWQEISLRCAPSL